jgi:hypothetical protein
VDAFCQRQFQTFLKVSCETFFEDRALLSKNSAIPSLTAKPLSHPWVVCFYLFIYNGVAFRDQKKSNIVRELGLLRRWLYIKMHKIDRIPFKQGQKMNGFSFFYNNITI